MHTDLTSHQLRRAADLKDRLDALQSELSELLGGAPEPARRRRLSTAARARIAAGQRARWRKLRAAGNGAVGRKPRRRMSAAHKALLAAAARARWRKAKAAGKNSL